MKQIRLWMLALPMLLGLASCTDTTDNPVDTNPLGWQLSGMWWFQTDKQGKDYFQTDYTKQIQVLYFSEDGTGWWCQLFYDDTNPDAVGRYGGKSSGDGGFTYTSLPDGTVNIKVNEDWDFLYYPKQLTVRLDGSRLIVVADGESYQMERPTNAMAAWLEEQSTGGNESNPSVVTLTTTVSFNGGYQTRALTVDGVKAFATGDKMAIIYEKTDGTKATAETEALTIDDIAIDNKSATFTVTLTAPKAGGSVQYIYPAAMAKDNAVNYDALATQDGTLETIASTLDLATYSGTLTPKATLPTSATLDNQLAILAVTLMDDNRNDEYNNLNIATHRLVLSDGTNTYTVKRQMYIAINTSPIYVAILPTVSANIELMALFHILIAQGYYTKSLTSQTYAAGNAYNLSPRMDFVPVGALPGKFTVADGKQVYFSRGNLQATTKLNGEYWWWAFAKKQYDYVGKAAANTSINGNGTVSANGTVDLFGWVGGKSSFTGVAQYGISNSDNYADYGNNTEDKLKDDWGNLAIDNGGNVANNGWFTLTKDEWGYLFNTRTVNGGTGAGHSYTLGQKAEGVLGVVVYPDSYTGPEYAGSDWSTFEEWGCVFLPAAGFRNGSEVLDAGTIGCYWASTADEEFSPYAYYVKFGADELNPSCSYERYCGQSVRLVIPIK